MSRIIKPERVGGFNDYGPAAMVARHALAARIRGVYETFGFREIETPCAEFRAVLTGDEGDNRLWTATLTRPDKIADMIATESAAGTAAGTILAMVRNGLGNDRPIALRFDHTVPLARYVAANMNELEFPWRRSVFGPVWRGESTQAGRYHQFYQFDADIVGVADLTADAEIIWMMTTAMGELTRHPYVVRWNSRKVLNGLANAVGLSAADPLGQERIDAMFRALDKTDSVPWDNVEALLRRQPENDQDPAPALDDRQVGLIEDFLTLSDQMSDPVVMLQDLRGVIGGTQAGTEGIDDLLTTLEILDHIGVSHELHAIDLSVARGLGYYDGIVFETVISGAERFGSVYSGGRYDGLIRRFTGERLAATGASIGFDRLYAVLEHLDDLPKVSASPVTALIMNFGDPDAYPTLLRILGILRRARVASEIYAGSDTNFRAQMNRAVKTEIPFLVIPGERELAKGVVAIRNMATKRQYEVPIDRLAEQFRL